MTAHRVATASIAALVSHDALRPIGRTRGPRRGGGGEGRVMDLRAVLLDLDLVAQWERRARYGSTLSGWSGDTDGTSRDASDGEVAALARALGVEHLLAGLDGGWEIAALLLTAALLPSSDGPGPDEHLRARLLAILDARALGLGVDRPDRDWSLALAHQRHLRELESHASTAIPAQVLRHLVWTAPPDTPEAEVIARVGATFAHPALRAGWQRAALARLGRTAARPKGGRPPIDRCAPPPAVARAVLGEELLAWGLATWAGQSYPTPAWCPQEYRP